MKVKGYLVIVTDALRGEDTLYPAPPSRKIVAVLARRGRCLTVRLKFAEVDPAGMVTCRNVPDKL
jgi:hypothetical protein